MKKLNTLNQSPVEKINSSPVKSQPAPATMSVVDVKTGCDRTVSLLEVLGAGIGKVKKDLNFKTEAEAAKNLQNSEIEYCQI